MNDSDVGYTYEWESDFSDQVKTNKKEDPNEKLEVSGIIQRALSFKIFLMKIKY